jgi:hypothetical protein
MILLEGKQQLIALGIVQLEAQGPQGENGQGQKGGNPMA